MGHLTSYTGTQGNQKGALQLCHSLVKGYRLLVQGFNSDSLYLHTMQGQRQWSHPIAKVEDSRSLQRARVVNRGEARRSTHEIKILSRAAALRHSDVERERAVLERVLEKVRTSTGYLNEDMHNQRT